MAYSVCYEERSRSGRGAQRSENFRTEAEALNRARELLAKDGDCAVAIRDDCGNIVAGVRLQLKLGYFPEAV